MLVYLIRWEAAYTTDLSAKFFVRNILLHISDHNIAIVGGFNFNIVIRIILIG